MGYNFTNAVFIDNRDPEWRTAGVQGGCLLFDGNSNYISYAPEELLVQGDALTVSVWVAPRAFEWDGPDNEANGTEHLTAIVGQYNKDKKQAIVPTEGTVVPDGVWSGGAATDVNGVPILFFTAGTVTKYFFCISPAPASMADNKAYFFLGDFDTETGKFTPDESFGGKPALLDYGSNVFTGPSALADPVSGNTYLFSIMQDQRTGAEEGAAGWAHCVGLAQGGNLTLDQANELLAGVSGDLLHLRITADVSQAISFTINVKDNGDKDLTQFSCVTADGVVGALTRNRGKECKSVYVDGPLVVEDGILTADIYIDRSLVEAYFNESRAISIRSYAAFGSQAISLTAEGGEVIVTELYVAQMTSIY